MDKQEFLEALASDAAAPGGGGGSAYVGAVGVALSQMALRVSLKTAKGEDVSVIENLVAEMESLRQALFAMVQKDADAFLPLSQAYKLPKSDLTRAEKIQKGLAFAAEVPMEMMRLNAEAIRLHQLAKPLANKMIVSDVGTGVIISLSSLKGAYMNVLVNTKSIKEEGLRKKLEDEGRYLFEVGIQMAEEVYSDIINLMG